MRKPCETLKHSLPGLGLWFQSLHGAGRSKGSGADRQRATDEERPRRPRGPGEGRERDHVDPMEAVVRPKCSRSKVHRY